MCANIYVHKRNAAAHRVPLGRRLRWSALSYGVVTTKSTFMFA